MKNHASIGSISANLTDTRWIVVVDDDVIVSTTVVTMLEDAGFRARSFGSAEDLLQSDWAEYASCLLLDEHLPGISGIEALVRLTAQGIRVPVVMITGSGDVPTAVAAMKAGARDFIEKPASDREILEAIDRVLNASREGPALDQLCTEASLFLAQLTPRQRQIVDMIVAGYPNKIIASDLGISQRTVEGHRAEIMLKSGVKSLPALTRLMFASSLVTENPVAAPQPPGFGSPAAHRDLLGAVHAGAPD